MSFTKEKLNSLFNYRDGKLFWKVSPNFRITVGSEAGSLGSHGYLNIKIDNKMYLAHRLIYIMHYGTCPKFIDHINSNKTDNRIENLRGCTNSQNLLNTKVRKTNSSGFKNVSWDTKRNKWAVQVSVSGKNKRFGLFDDLELACLVAVEARNKYHKEFVNHG